MADKLDWLNRHLVLLRYLSVDEILAKENFKIRPDLAEFYAGVDSAEEMAFKLARLEKHKDACELIAYIAHRRAAVWWDYRCVMSLYEELQENPAVDQDIADIGTSFTPEVPDFAKVELPKMDPAVNDSINAGRAQIQGQIEELTKKVDPKTLALVKEGVETAFQEFKRVHGIHPVDLLKKLGKKIIDEPRYQVDPNSPIFLESAKLKAQLGVVQKETVATIKAVIPPKVPEHEKKMRDNAMAAVYRWIAAPDAENSQTCLNIGNECPDTPAGLLALSAFWAFGNLMPLGEQIVPTPPGLAANGLSQVLLMCALHKGGTRKLKERYELYFNLGVEVLSGRDLWDESLKNGEAPHETIGSAHRGEPEKTAPRQTVPVAPSNAQRKPIFGVPAAVQEDVPAAPSVSKDAPSGTPRSAPETNATPDKPPAAPQSPPNTGGYKRWKAPE
ncbi:MAG: hypothetical protein LBP76_14265 [Treponema sp.]|jgi:hypothetical protein|nr:hypothetical protein [Treponema sp.]